MPKNLKGVINMGMDIEIMKLNSEMIKYTSALKVLETQLEIINDTFKYTKSYNPIEHIKTRIKTVDSIKKKLKKKGYRFTLKNIEEHINDIVGVRVICSFEDDVYDLVDIIRKSEILTVVKEKDYIKTPKPTGYRSYHMIVKVPVPLINDNAEIYAEIQIRTLAMDLWASLDHKLNYKSDYTTKRIANKMYKVSNELFKIDEEMSKTLKLENKIKKQSKKK
jgi:putative GTP pyrophosphokinase